MNVHEAMIRNEGKIKTGRFGSNRLDFSRLPRVNRSGDCLFISFYFSSLSGWFSLATKA